MPDWFLILLFWGSYTWRAENRYSYFIFESSLFLARDVEIKGNGVAGVGLDSEAVRLCPFEVKAETQSQCDQAEDKKNSVCHN